MDAQKNGSKCGFCKNITKYKCINCHSSACNKCTLFEENEEATGWQIGVSVGYCIDCQLTLGVSAKSLMKDINAHSTTANSEDFEEESEYFKLPPPLETNSESNDDDSEASFQIKSRKKKSGKKKSGRKTMWSDNALNDFVDIITGSEYYKKKLIFTNTKNQKNGIIYEKILTELRTRCDERNETINFTITQMRNKFKKCISECKHAAMTIKTATGIKRFQEDKGYGAWFKQLFPLVQTRDSCQPEMAVEPSCGSGASTCSASSKSLIDPEEDDLTESENTDGVKVFVPLKKKKLSAKDHVGEAVTLLKTLVENDPSKELINFMRDEAEKSRKHELEMTKLLLSYTAPSQQAEREMEVHPWQQQHYLNAPHYQHLQHQASFQVHPTSTESYTFSPPDNVGKHYHTL